MMAQAGDPLLQRPLYVFDLPKELLYTLQLKAQSTKSSTTNEATSDSQTLAPESQRDPEPVTATSCSLCSLTFASLEEQRSHVRSDLHGYNLKQKLKSRKPITEIEFERLVGELDESISGSDSTASNDSGDEDVNGGGGKQKDTTLSALLKRQAKIADGDAEDAPSVKRQRGAGTPPMVWFNSPRLSSKTSLGIYRAIFSKQEQTRSTSLAETLQHKQYPPNPTTKPPKPQPLDPSEAEDEGGVPLPQSTIPQPPPQTNDPHYFLCMIGGGHFAAMLVSLVPKVTRNHGIEDRTATVLVHKTFHRYTTRRKQGGSQSANDNAKGNAHSAGSSIRRYNESALEHEVRELLAQWRGLIDSAELVFVRATGSTNRRTLFGPYDGQVLNIKDERVRGFPFSTRRATQAELMRAFVELTRVKVSTIDEAALARQQAAEAEAAAAAKTEATSNGTATTPKQPKPSKADEEAALHTTQLQALIRRSKAPALLFYLQTHNLSPNYTFHPADTNHHAPTPLHLAAASNSPACVSALLVKGHADPGVKNAEGKSPFEIAGDRSTREAFRLARSVLGEEKWKWDAAAVPAALSQSEIEARNAEEKNAKSAVEETEKVRRAAELERLRAEDARKVSADAEKKFGKGNLVGKGVMSAEERRAEDARGMSEEMRLRLEREKRARAAEERMKRLQGQGGK